MAFRSRTRIRRDTIVIGLWRNSGSSENDQCRHIKYNECLRFWVIQQEEPCWLGEVVLMGVRVAGDGAPVTRTGQVMPCAAAVKAFTQVVAQSFSPPHSSPRKRQGPVSTSPRH